MNKTAETPETAETPAVDHEHAIALYIAGMMVLLVVAGLVIAWAI